MAWVFFVQFSLSLHLTISEKYKLLFCFGFKKQINSVLTLYVFKLAIRLIVFEPPSWATLAENGFPAIKQE